MVLSLRTPTFRNFTFAELREDVVVIRARIHELVNIMFSIQLF